MATDLQSVSGKKLLASGTEISENLLELLKNRPLRDGVKEPICIDIEASDIDETE